MNPFRLPSPPQQLINSRAHRVFLKLGVVTRLKERLTLNSKQMGLCLKIDFASHYTNDEDKYFIMF